MDVLCLFIVIVVYVHYHLNEDSGISSNRICHHVVPNIKRVYRHVVAKVFRHALMWRIFDATQSLVCDADTVSRVEGLYSRVEGMLLMDVLCFLLLLMIITPHSFFLDIYLSATYRGRIPIY